MRMCTQNITTPTIILNFREKNFCDQKSNHKIHENIVLRKFGAIRYFNCDLRIDGGMILITPLSMCVLKIAEIVNINYGWHENVLYWHNN